MFKFIDEIWLMNLYKWQIEWVTDEREGDVKWHFGEHLKQYSMSYYCPCFSGSSQVVHITQMVAVYASYFVNVCPDIFSR